MATPRRETATLAERCGERVLRAVGDLLDSAGSPELRQVRLAGSDDALLDQAILAIARLARQRGYIPLATAVLDRGVVGRPSLTAEAIWRMAARRPRVRVHDLRGGAAAARSRLAYWLGRVSGCAPRPRVVIAVERTCRPARVGVGSFHAEYLRLEPLSWSAEVAPEATYSLDDGPPCRVAEAPAEYGVSPERSFEAATVPEGPATATFAGGPPRRGKAERAARAWALALRGRHAQAERLLRDAVGQWARRGFHAEAGEAALTLGRVLLRRGRPSGALKAFTAARHHYLSGSDVVAAGRASAVVGLSLTDDGKLDEAEATLAAAQAAAMAAGDAEVTRFAALGLARCLLWKGQPERAHAAVSAMAGRTLAPSAGRQGVGDATVARDAEDHGQGSWDGRRRQAGGVTVDVDLDPDVAEASLRAGIASRLGDVPAAAEWGGAALVRALATGSADDHAAARTALAAHHAAAGDLDGLRRDVEAGIRAARAAHAPVRAIHLRLILADGLTRAGAGAEARRVAGRLTRIRASRFPPLYRAKWERLVERATWAGAAPAGRGPTALPARWVTERAVEILSVVQGDGDEATVLERAMRTLLGQLDGCAAAVWGQYGEATVAIAGAGVRLEAGSSVRRAIDAGQVVAPERVADGFEAAAPVRYAGAVAGAIAVRWAIDRRVDHEAAVALLATTATATAPLVRAHLDRAVAVPPDAGDGLIGTSEAMDRLRKAIARAGGCPFPVLIEGESGSGKEVVARAIHRASVRRTRRLVAVNCAAVTDDLFEAELFGHARGAFTGAMVERPGLVEEAHGSTLLLDEVSELTPRGQAKLLRVIQEGEIRRVGENLVRPVDVRVIVATNRPLRDEVSAGRFRRDLFYRLEVLRLEVPPLRDRVDDVPALARYFWERATARIGSRATLSSAVTAALARYDWPGNVRELQNVLTALAVAAGRRGVVGPSQLPASIAAGATGCDTATLEDAKRVFERRFVLAALARAGGHRGRAAHDLGLSRQGLAKVIGRLRIDLPAAGPAR